MNQARQRSAYLSFLLFTFVLGSACHDADLRVGSDGTDGGGGGNALNSSGDSGLAGGALATSGSGGVAGTGQTSAGGGPAGLSPTSQSGEAGATRAPGGGAGATRAPGGGAGAGEATGGNANAGGQAGATRPSTTGSGGGLQPGDASAGPPDASGSGGTGGSAQDGSTGPTQVHYRACQIGADADHGPTIVVAKWDPAICVCTRVRLENKTSCAFPLQNSAWCAVDAQLSKEVGDCESNVLATRTSATALSGTGAATKSEDWQVDLSVYVSADPTTGLPSSTQLETQGCWATGNDDCAPTGPVVIPTTATASLYSYCGQYYEIEVTNPDGFYVGAMDWQLAVGTSVFTQYRSARGGTYTLLFRLSPAQFDALTDGDPIKAAYGSGAGRTVDYGPLSKAMVHPG